MSDTEEQTGELQGLSDREVIARRADGKGNNIPRSSSRPYRQIFNENLFTFINAAFFTISLVMFLLGRVGDGILVAVVIFGGVLVNIGQEIWAKRKLDEIALLHRPKAIVIREGKERSVDPSEIVLGDVLVLLPGDQILVDGAIIGNGRIEVDESLLTGESDSIPKMVGVPVYSGSFCVSGTACYQAEKVGTDTVAHKLMTGARAFRQVLTPVQHEINVVIRVFLLIACFLWILVGISFLSRSYSLNDVIQRAAVIAGLVPAGLLLAITLAYGLGAVRMIGEDVLIQQANAVESLSNVDILCLDKTGTLTTNQIELQEIYPIGVDEEELRSLLGIYAASTIAGNKTNDAIANTYPGVVMDAIAEVPFSSVRKWSALAFDATATDVSYLAPGTYVLGAPEFLMSLAGVSPDVADYIEDGIQQGLRVVMFAHSPEKIAPKENSTPELPLDLKPLGLLRFSDQLRPEAKQTLDGFAEAGIEVKIISGDNPKTVAALAKQAGLGEDIEVVSGQELALMDQVQFIQTALTSTVFGRITPDQKADLVRGLRRRGKYVAMIGDGVNDVLALKQANLAIAMESGSKATRSVADIVLLKDSFAALPHTFLEGQRIRNGIQDVMKLFLVRTFCVTLLVFATAIVTDSFPLQNKQSAIVALVGVGFPTMFIPVWAKAGAIPRRSMVRGILHFVIPATLTLTLVALFVYLFYLVVAILDLQPNLDLLQVDYATPRSALVTILIMGELLLLPFLKPPTQFWVGGEPLSGDWRYTIVAIALLGIYFLILAVPPFRNFFELQPLSLWSYLFLAFVAFEWCLILRAIWRSRFLDRFLGIDLG
ncbi:HAD-IC family P-type ATPase [Phormidium sp. CLA17]|uniref:HAD-IC family P-type ATPase n=1 Tax=Leptolyngbya sp. Cla-17 TaxID=2803751 RepID=UPI001492FBB1|nr:HAD-IC family P-type ATPase [Leptolyngbya sp. Cla-17]MBM0740594.1 HAD-IC family P-type ATPase [Leptolyngbya sp. Cla-17]